MCEGLRELATLPEDQSLALTWQFTGTCNSSTSDSDALFGPLPPEGTKVLQNMHGGQTYS